jgi:hypothetical protein
MLISPSNAVVTPYIQTAEKEGNRVGLMSHSFSGLKFECRKKALRFPLQKVRQRNCVYNKRE